MSLHSRAQARAKRVIRNKYKEEHKTIYLSLLGTKTNPNATSKTYSAAVTILTNRHWREYKALYNEIKPILREFDKNS